MRPVCCIFMDPPDAIGLKYSSFKDDMSNEEYRQFINTLIWKASEKCDVMWLSHNAKHTFFIGGLVDIFLEANKDWEGKSCQQIFTFGQNNKRDLGNGHRPLIRLMKRGSTLYPDAIRVPSWRQLNGDKRAATGGRVPLDVFNFPRVTGNAGQRRKWHPTQLHEGLYERCIKLCCQEGDTVCDLFAGTGTLARVADRCGVNALLVEIDKGYCERIAEEHNLEISDD